MTLSNRAAMLALYGQDDEDDESRKDGATQESKRAAQVIMGRTTMTQQTQTHTQNANKTPMLDSDIFATVTSLLLELPGEVRQVDNLATGLGLEVKEARRDVQDAELDAQLNCAADAKNAEGRKLQIEKAVRDDPAAVAKRSHLADVEASLALAEMDLRSQLKRWQGALALAELQAAKINYLAKINTTPRNNTR